MPRYFYIAKSFEGEDKSGILDVKNKPELSRILHQQGLVLVSASIEKEKAKKGKLVLSLPSFGGVSLVDKMMFTRNLQVMISAGVTLPRGLNILSVQTKNQKFKKAIIEISEDILKGKSFSESLGKYPEIFRELFVSMIKVGEEAGTLERVLKDLTYQMDREHNLKSEIKSAMIYPTVIIAAMAGIGALMLIMVVPKLAETFEELEIPLPATTQFVIGLGNFLVVYWFFLPFIIFFLLLLFRVALKTKIGKRSFDGILLKIPIISPIIKKANSAQTLRTLSSLITAGIPIVQALEIVSGTLGNFYFKEAMLKAVEEVKKGGKFSEALKPYQNIYPLIMLQMIEVGEETGTTSDILAKLADFFEEEVTADTKNLSALIEPLLMLLIGGAVGFFAISMIQPMYSMLGAIR
ncbi:type II secretion system F family protein [Patescibacteria group bacterium]|nr:type II secretion system F family protein [Patescibacteria group bacterium]